MRKIGFIILALVLALGSIGIGYAAWTDTVTLEGTVKTGSVDINVVGYSWTLVYKIAVPDPNPDTLPPWPDETLIVRGKGPVPPDMTANAGKGPDPVADDGTNLDTMGYDWELVAGATCEPADDPVDDAVIMKFWNLFPSIDFVADVILHYEGTVPVRVQVADVEVLAEDANADPPIPDGTWLEEMFVLAPGGTPPASGAWISGWEWNYDNAPTDEFFPGSTGAWIPYAPGYQLHYCDAVLIEFGIHLPQTWPDGHSNEGEVTTGLMNQSAAFKATLEVKQWNEYDDGS
jgi:predicted ribosomally synthesized peptide with SipW-like signal peptide